MIGGGPAGADGGRGAGARAGAVGGGVRADADPGAQVPDGRAWRAEPHAFRGLRAARRGSYGGAAPTLAADAGGLHAGRPRGLGRGAGPGDVRGHQRPGASPRRWKASPLAEAWIARLEGQGVAPEPVARTLTGWNAGRRPDLRDPRRAARRAVARHDPGHPGWASWAKPPARMGALGAAVGWRAARRGRRCSGRPMSGSPWGGPQVFRGERLAGAPLKNIGLSFEGAGSRAATPLAAGYAGWRAGRPTPCRRLLRDAIQCGGFGEAGDRPAARSLRSRRS